MAEAERDGKVVFWITGDGVTEIEMVTEIEFDDDDGLIVDFDEFAEFNFMLASELAGRTKRAFLYGLGLATAVFVGWLWGR